MSGNPFNLRVARPTDAEGITAVLTSAYTSLMAPFYDPAVMAVLLPSMTIANPVLLESQTYYVQDYVQETPEAQIVSCGGWTQTEPGTNKVENGVAHIRHFGTHVDWTRRGLGAGIFERCRHDALAVGVHTFWCFSKPRRRILLRFARILRSRADGRRHRWQLAGAHDQDDLGISLIRPRFILRKCYLHGAHQGCTPSAERDYPTFDFRFSNTALSSCPTKRIAGLKRRGELCPMNSLNRLGLVPGCLKRRTLSI